MAMVYMPTPFALADLDIWFKSDAKKCVSSQLFDLDATDRPCKERKSKRSLSSNNFTSSSSNKTRTASPTTNSTRASRNRCAMHFKAQATISLSAYPPLSQTRKRWTSRS